MTVIQGAKVCWPFVSFSMPSISRISKEFLLTATIVSSPIKTSYGSKSRQEALPHFLLSNHFLASGAKILEVVACATPEEPVTTYLEDMEFLNDELFMEWAWVVDLDSRVLEACTHWDRYKIMDEESRFENVLGCEKKLPGLVKVWVRRVASVR